MGGGRSCVGFRAIPEGCLQQFTMHEPAFGYHSLLLEWTGPGVKGS